MIESALRTLALADATLSGLVGTRVYPLKLPQDPTYPAITYFRVSGTEEYAHGGTTDLAQGRFQFDVWAGSYSSAKEVAAALRDAINGHSGTVGGVAIANVTRANVGDGYEPQQGDEGDYRVSVDYWVQYTE